jgi:hypothetical protein
VDDQIRDCCAQIVLSGKTIADSLAKSYGAAFRRGFFPRRCVLEEAGGHAPIAQALDRDLGFFARYLAHPRAGRHAAMNLEPQCLGDVWPMAG